MDSMKQLNLRELSSRLYWAMERAIKIVQESDGVKNKSIFCDVLASEISQWPEFTK